MVCMFVCVGGGGGGGGKVNLKIFLNGTKNPILKIHGDPQT